MADRFHMREPDERDVAGGPRTRQLYVVAAMADGRWRIETKHDASWFFSTRAEAEDCAIALALRSVPNVIRVQSKDGKVQSEIRYE